MNESTPDALRRAAPQPGYVWHEFFSWYTEVLEHNQLTQTYKIRQARTQEELTSAEEAIVNLDRLHDLISKSTFLRYHSNYDKPNIMRPGTVPNAFQAAEELDWMILAEEAEHFNLKLKHAQKEHERRFSMINLSERMEEYLISQGYRTERDNSRGLNIVWVMY